MKKKIFFVVCLFVSAVVTNADMECYRVDVLGLFNFEYGINWSIYRANRDVESFYIARDVGVGSWVGDNLTVAKVKFQIKESHSLLKYIDNLNLESELLIEEWKEIEIDGHQAILIRTLETTLQEQIIFYIIEIEDGRILELTGYLRHVFTEIANNEFEALIQSIRFNN